MVKVLNCIHCNIPVKMGVICPDCRRRKHREVVTESATRMAHLTSRAAEIGAFDLMMECRHRAAEDLEELETLN